MKCYKCEKHTKDYESDKRACANCREYFKIDLVNLIIGDTRIILSDLNRNKKGAPHKLTATQEHNAYCENKNEGTSMAKLAEKYNVSKTKIFNIVKNNKNHSR
jgi:hypothetical protein